MCPTMYKAFGYIMSIHLKFKTFLSFTLLLNTKKLGLRKDEHLDHKASKSGLNPYLSACSIHDLNHLPHWFHDQTELCFK